MICPAGHRVIDSTGQHYTMREVSPGLYAYLVGACEKLVSLSCDECPPDSGSRLFESRTVKARLLDSIEKLPDAPGCWLWTKALIRGYGQISTGRGRTDYAHRVAYQLFRGLIPNGLTLDHLCRVPVCVNPWHLEPVTLTENTRRAAILRTRCPRGHPLDGVTTRSSGERQRYCRRCNRERVAARKAANRKPPVLRVACNRGHAYTPENTRWRGGERVCRTCVRERMRAKRAALRRAS